jgi:hypothetical protein
MRFMQGKFVAADGKTHSGTFAFIEFCISNQDAFTVAMATWNSG